jgi:hypothetical protein
VGTLKNVRNGETATICIIFRGYFWDKNLGPKMGGGSFKTSPKFASFLPRFWFRISRNQKMKK